MCGRYWIEPDDSSEQLKEIIDTINRGQAEGEKPKRMKLGEVFPRLV